MATTYKTLVGGAHDGIYCSRDGGVTFDAIDAPLEVAVRRKVGHHQAPSGLRCGATGVFKRIIKGVNRSALDGRAMHRSQTGNR
jgi:hypothetical protein